MRRGRSRRCRNRRRSPRNARHAPARSTTAWTIPSRRTSPIVTTRCPPSTASRCIAAELAKRRQPDLGDVAPRQAILAQRPHRIAVAKAVARVAQVEMRIERDQPDLARAAARAHAPPAGSPHYCRRPAASAHAARRSPRTASRIGAVACSMLSPSIATSPWSAIRARQLAPRLDVVAPDPLQRRAQQRRREVAAPRRHRSRRPAARRPARPAHRRPSATIRSARLGQLPCA